MSPAEQTLNPAQESAAGYGGDGPLLILAGAGSGKTHTLAQRVARLIAGGADPRRILLLTFTRRAALEMTRRARQTLTSAGLAAPDLCWAGTFHSIANRLLRLHCQSVELDPSFTVLDRGDAAGLLDLIRNRLGLSKKSRRFPRKGTCLSIYSRVVNAQESLETALKQHFTWCTEWQAELRELFREYVVEKQRQCVLDYDDLLLYWFHAMTDADVAADVAARFDHVLVDEYQDTNALQAAILHGLRPSGEGLTVVGDDAQAIYSFRAATVKNILDFPAQFERPAEVVTLEENYRSTQPILAAANAVMARANQGYRKTLHSSRRSLEKPILAQVEDEDAEVDYVVERILEAREAGTPLTEQAVLFRTAHHSDALEIELGRRNIPFVKFGGLKFLEAAHVKDLLCFLRWAENPRDSVAAFRVLQLMPGIGPALAARILDCVSGTESRLGALRDYVPPAAARPLWGPFCDLMERLTSPRAEWAEQVGEVRRFYEPLLAELYDHADARASDLDQLEHVSGAYADRERFLSELSLDPPSGTGDFAGPPHLDEEYLILSTIHSAKGQEWDAVYLLHAVDGCIPSDLSTGDAELIEEERRLLYVAMTRARDSLHVVQPLRFRVRQQSRHGDRHVYAPRTRFLDEATLELFERRVTRRESDAGNTPGARSPAKAIPVASRLRDMW